MGGTASYQRLENYDHLYKFSEKHYLDPMKRNILIYENGKYYKWDIQHIHKNNGERIPVYIGTDEKGIMTIYNP